MAGPEKTCQCRLSNCGFLYDPDRGDKRTKIPRELISQTCRQIGMAPAPGPAKRGSGA